MNAHMERIGWKGFTEPAQKAGWRKHRQVAFERAVAATGLKPTARELVFYRAAYVRGYQAGHMRGKDWGYRKGWAAAIRERWQPEKSWAGERGRGPRAA